MSPPFIQSHDPTCMVYFFHFDHLLCARQFLSDIHEHPRRGHHARIRRRRRAHVGHELRLFLPVRVHADPGGHPFGPLGFAQHHRLVPPHRGGGVAPVRPFRLGNGGDGRPRAHRRRHGHGLRARLAGDPVLVPSGTARPRHGLDPFPSARAVCSSPPIRSCCSRRPWAGAAVCSRLRRRPCCGRRHMAVGTQPPRRGRVRPGMGFHRSPQTPRPALA